MQALAASAPGVRSWCGRTARGRRRPGQPWVREGACMHVLIQLPVNLDNFKWLPLVMNTVIPCLCRARGGRATGASAQPYHPAECFPVRRPDGGRAAGSHGPTRGSSPASRVARPPMAPEKGRHRRIGLGKDTGAQRHADLGTALVRWADAVGADGSSGTTEPNPDRNAPHFSAIMALCDPPNVMIRHDVDTEAGRGQAWLRARRAGDLREWEARVGRPSVGCRDLSV